MTLDFPAYKRIGSHRLLIMIRDLGKPFWVHQPNLYQQREQWMIVAAGKELANERENYIYGDPAPPETQVSSLSLH